MQAVFELLAKCQQPFLIVGGHAPALAHLIALKLHAIRNNPERESRDFGDIAELLRLNAGKISRGELEELCRQFAPPGIEAKLLSLL